MFITCHGSVISLISDCSNIESKPIGLFVEQIWSINRSSLFSDKLYRYLDEYVDSSIDHANDRSDISLCIIS